MQQKGSISKNGQYKTLPGDIIAQAEEYLPGMNSLEINGQIVALSVGGIRRDDRHLVISVLPEKVIHRPRRGSIVYGQVIKADRGNYRVKIGAYWFPGASHIFETNEDASLVVSGSRNGDMAPVAVGDYIRAKVLSDRNGYSIGIGGKNLGVVKAFCSNCRSELVLKGRFLYCENCERTEPRKISDDYGKIYVEDEKHAR